ncbi:MAG: sigma-70 family RNA polymerase sigma factor [Ardenticatenaceae bacterium]|nr:sigma-70 family RNA polymerase sigma factor [Ardenticatenaceae bacterium]MCB8974747.1 sigma-70 family RNA polymerase sigma factor [Ardenticatenaceae bacterium]
MTKLTTPFDEMDFVSVLLNEGSEQGYITYDQIMEALPDVEDNLPLLETILEEAQAAGIPIYENEDEVEAQMNGDDSSDLSEALANGKELQDDDEDDVELSPHAAPLFDLSNVPIDDSVGLYFREMGQQGLLSAEEEVNLAMEIEAGKEAEARMAEEILSLDEQDQLANLREIADMARAHLIRANTRLVVSIAKKYRGRGLQFLDLIQEGNVGLMKAVEKYDYRRGNRFSTYATWWIRQAVTRALANHGRTIRIPAHLGGRISKLYQVAQELEQEYGRQPTAEEIAEHMELPAERVRWMLRTSRQPVHLERPVGDESDAELGDFIEDVDAPPPAETVAQKMLTEELGEILDQLTPREARILRLRYGLQDGESRTLKEVGEMFGLSRERIRQLEKEALRKLRHPNFAGHLRQYLN